MQWQPATRRLCSASPWLACYLPSPAFRTAATTTRCVSKPPSSCSTSATPAPPAYRCWWPARCAPGHRMTRTPLGFRIFGKGLGNYHRWLHQRRELCCGVSFDSESDCGVNRASANGHVHSRQREIPSMHFNCHRVIIEGTSTIYSDRNSVLNPVLNKPLKPGTVQGLHHLVELVDDMYSDGGALSDAGVCCIWRTLEVSEAAALNQRCRLLAAAGLPSRLVALCARARVDWLAVREQMPPVRPTLIHNTLNLIDTPSTQSAETSNSIYPRCHPADVGVSSPAQYLPPHTLCQKLYAHMLSRTYVDMTSQESDEIYPLPTGNTSLFSIG